MKIKIDDKVRCVAKGSFYGLTENKEYIVSGVRQVSTIDAITVVNDYGNVAECLIERFEKVVKEISFKIGDTVRCIEYNNFYLNELTLYKEYTVLETKKSGHEPHDEHYIRIMNDSGFKSIYLVERFEKVVKENEQVTKKIDWTKPLSSQFGDNVRLLSVDMLRIESYKKYNHLVAMTHYNIDTLYFCDSDGCIEPGSNKNNYRIINKKVKKSGWICIRTNKDGTAVVDHNIVKETKEQAKEFSAWGTPVFIEWEE